MKKRNKSKTASKSPRQKHLLVLLIILFLLIGTVSLIQQWTKISDIECNFDDQACPQSVTEQVEKLKGRSLFFLNTPKFISEEVAPIYPVSLVEIEKKLPNKMTVKLQPEPASYLLATEDHMYQVSRSGLVFSATSNQDQQLTQVKLPSASLSEQDQLDSKTHYVISQILAAAENASITLDDIVWHDQLNIELVLPEHDETFIIDSEQVELDLVRLKTIIESDEYQSIEGRPQSLDLRFELPVLRTTQ